MNSKQFNGIKILKGFPKKRIAYVFNHPYFLGGGEISFFELVRSINRKAFEPIIIVPASGEIENVYDERKETVFISPFPPLKQINFYRPFYALVNLSKILKNNNIDIIHVNGSRACFYAGLAGRILGIPVIWHVRESLKDLLLYDGLLSLLSNVIICVSKSVRDRRFERFGRLIRKKIFVVYNGVDTVKFNPTTSGRNRIRNALNIEKDEVFFGIVGNIIPRKGQDFFLRAFVAACEKNSAVSKKLLIIGRPLDLNFFTKLQHIMSENSLRDRVIIEDYCESISDYLAALDVFVLPSKSEGFARSLIEAMSSGLPVLATKINEIEEAVIDGENGILVKFGAVDEMASAICRLAANSSLRKKMGTLNNRWVGSRFGLQHHAKAIARVYQKIV